MKFSYNKQFYKSPLSQIVINGVKTEVYSIAVDSQDGKSSNIIIPKHITEVGTYSNIFKTHNGVLRVPKAPGHHFLLINSYRCDTSFGPAVIVRHNTKFVKIRKEFRTPIISSSNKECSDQLFMQEIELFYCKDLRMTVLGEIRMIPSALLANDPDPVLQELNSGIPFLACCEIITCEGVGHLVADSREILIDVLCRVRQADIDMESGLCNESNPEGVILVNVKRLHSRNLFDASNYMLFKANNFTRALHNYYEIDQGRLRFYKDLRNPCLAAAWDDASAEKDGQIEKLLEADSHAKICSIKQEMTSADSDEQKYTTPETSKIHYKRVSAAIESTSNTTKEILRKLMTTAESSNDDKTDCKENSSGNIKIKNLFSDEFNSCNSEADVAPLVKQSFPRLPSPPISTKPEVSLQSVIQPNKQSELGSSSRLWDKLFFMENRSLASYYPTN